MVSKFINNIEFRFSSKTILEKWERDIAENCDFHYSYHIAIKPIDKNVAYIYENEKYKAFTINADGVAAECIKEFDYDRVKTVYKLTEVLSYAEAHADDAEKVRITVIYSKRKAD